MDEGQQTHTASPWLAFGLTGLAVYEEDVIDSLLADLAA
jgi:hypothetical protein